MAQNYTVRMRDGTVTEVADVASETTVDEEVYDLANYRNELDASTLGRAWTTATFAGETTPATLAVAEARDDRVNAVVPRPELKKRTRLFLWSAAGGTGDILFAGWLDRIEAYSTGEFIRV